MKKKLSVYLKKETAYKLAKDMNCAANRVYEVYKLDPDAVIIFNSDKRPVRIEYSIKRNLEAK